MINNNIIYVSEDYKIRVYVTIMTRFSNNKLYSDITNLPRCTYIVIINHCKYIMYIVLSALPFLGTHVTIKYILITLMVVIIDI